MIAEFEKIKESKWKKSIMNLSPSFDKWNPTLWPIPKDDIVYFNLYSEKKGQRAPASVVERQFYSYWNDIGMKLSDKMNIPERRIKITYPAQETNYPHFGIIFPLSLCLRNNPHKPLKSPLIVSVNEDG